MIRVTFIGREFACTGFVEKTSDTLVLDTGEEFRGIGDWSRFSFDDDSGGMEVFAAKMTCIRKQRNMLLAECDWTHTLDGSGRLTPEEREAWRVYRQALADLPENIDLMNVDNPPWPIAPAGSEIL